MSSLLVSFVMMILLAALFVVVPLARFRSAHNKAEGDVRQQKNIQVFQQSLKELENDLTNLVVNEEDFGKLKTELERNFMSDMEAVQTQNLSASQHANKMLPLVFVLLLFVAGYIFYQQIGSGQDLVIPELIAQIQTAQSEEEQNQVISDLAVALDSRYQRHTDNIQLGYTLGGVYTGLEQFSDAERIFSQLTEEMQNTPDKGTVLGQLAQSQYLLAGSVMTDKVNATIAQALELNPNEQAVMSLLAIDAFVNLDFATALNYWRRQLLQLPQGSREAAAVRDRIVRVEELILAEERVNVTEAELGASVTIRVEVDESIRDQIAQDMRLFVFARGKTMPMPLAAQTYSLDQLPLTVTLDDSMAMTPQFTLSSSEQVYVGARISRVATAQSGDFQVLSETFNVSEQEEIILLTIKDIVP